MSAHADPNEVERKFPPIRELAILTLTLIVAGGVYMAAKVGYTSSLIPAVILLGVAAAIALANVALLVRLRDFAWDKFFLVSGWALAAYVVIAGMLEFVFIYDHTPARALWVFTGMLAVFALNVPMLLGFSVARYQEPKR